MHQRKRRNNTKLRLNDEKRCCNTVSLVWNQAYANYQIPPTHQYIGLSRSQEDLLGDVETSLSGQAQGKASGGHGRYLPRFKPDRWDNIAQQLLNCCVEQDLGDEATEKGQMQAWLEQYLSDKPVMENAEAAMVSGDPFRQGGNTYIFGSDFRKWIRVVHMEKVTETLEQCCGLSDRAGKNQC